MPFQKKAIKVKLKNLKNIKIQIKILNNKLPLFQN